MANQKRRFWDTQDLFLQVLEMRHGFLQQLIWMFKPVKLDPRIPVRASQRERILKVVQAIWDDFKTKMHDYMAPKYQTSAFPAMVGLNIFLWSWDKILALTVEIANIIKAEKDLKPEVGVIAFGHKKVELLRQASFVFMCGNRTGSRSTALQMLLPLVHAATYDAAAQQ